MSNVVNYENMQSILTKIGQKFDALEGAYTYRGSVTFANLPATLAKSMVGYVYDVSDDFTTDERFIEGAGKKYAAGTDVAIADASEYTYEGVIRDSEKTYNAVERGWYELVDGKYVLSKDTNASFSKNYYTREGSESYKFDVHASFVNVDSIENRITSTQGSIADAFDKTKDYAAGDVVVHENGLYKFKSAHEAGEWDADEADATTIENLIESAEPSGLTEEQVAALIALLD